MKLSFITKKQKPIMRQRNDLLYETLQYTGKFDVVTTFELISYNEKEVNYSCFKEVDDLMASIKPENINWIIVKGLSQTDKIAVLGKRLRISNLWMQDVLSTRDIAKVERYNNQVITIIDHFFYNDEKQLIKQHCSLVMNPTAIVWFQESNHGLFTEIIKAISGNKGKVRVKRVDYLYNLLISSIVDSYLTLLDEQRNILIDMEDQLMDFTDESTSIGRDLQYVRKEFLLLRKSIIPLREPFKKFVDNDTTLILPENRSYFQDTIDHMHQVFQLIDNNKEMITSLVDLYMANNDHRLNKIMSRLTVISVIFIPLTFLAGIWGMNYAVMPELQWKYGYLFAWSTMLLTASIIIIWLKRKKWF